MFCYTENNHFKFGYDNEDAFAGRKSADQKWWIRYGKSKYQPKSFYDECLVAAKKIKASTNKKITVLFSGGVDSEVVVRSFREAHIECEVAILRFKNDLNVHDISYAVMICEKLNMKYKLYDLDIETFWKTTGLAIAKKIKCPSPQLVTTMHLCDQIGGLPVIASGECLLIKNVPADYVPGKSEYLSSTWSMWEKEKIAGFYRHFIENNSEGIPAFFQYTPELIYSYLVDPFVSKLVNDQIHGKLTTESSKFKIYKQYFDLIERPKYSGFEKILDMEEMYRMQYREVIGHYNDVVKTEYKDLLKQVGPSV